MQFISFIQMWLKKYVPSVYWVSAILFAFALGTAAGDLAAEGLHFGHALSALRVGVLIPLGTSVRLVDIPPHLKKV